MSSVITMANADSGAFSGGGGGGTCMNYVAGEAIDITKKSNTGTSSVKYDGSSIILNENGELMANIPEPEPTELYNAGDGIDISDRIISVKHDDTLSINEQGQLHVVNSGGGSDSLFEKHKIYLSKTYDWSEFDIHQKITINDQEVQFNEYQNVPHDYEPDNGIIVSFFTDDPSLGQAEIRKEDGNFIVPYYHEPGSHHSLTPDEYVNSGSRIGIVGNWGSVWNNVSLKQAIKYEDIFSYYVIKPKEDLPITATNIDFDKVEGVDEFIIDFKNMKTIKKEKYNYLYFINVPQFDKNVDVMNIVLSSLMKDSMGNQFKEVITSYSADKNKWIIPEFTVNTTNGATDFTLEYKEYDEGPGISFIDSFTSPYDQFMRGEISFQWLPQTDAIESKYLKCRTIEADNTFKLYRSPVPFFYVPKVFGEVTIDEKHYWYIDWDCDKDSEMFQTLVDGQPFEFHDNAFGTKFIMKKTADGWTGSNLCYHSVASDITKHEHSSMGSAYLFIRATPMVKSIFMRHFKWDGSSKPLSHLVNNNYFVARTNKDPKPTEETTAEENTEEDKEHKISITEENTETINDEQYYVLHFTVSGTYSSLYLDLQCGVKTVTFEWQKVYIAEGAYNYNPKLNLIKDLPYHEEASLGAQPFQSLKLYIEKDHVYKINDNNYKVGTNPFSFLAQTFDYKTVPAPESCTTLMTTHNIRTSGVVI